MARRTKLHFVLSTVICDIYIYMYIYIYIYIVRVLKRFRLAIVEHGRRVLGEWRRAALLRASDTNSGKAQDSYIGRQKP